MSDHQLSLSVILFFITVLVVLIFTISRKRKGTVGILLGLMAGAVVWLISYYAIAWGWKGTNYMVIQDGKISHYGGKIIFGWFPERKSYEIKDMVFPLSYTFTRGDTLITIPYSIIIKVIENPENLQKYYDRILKHKVMDLAGYMIRINSVIITKHAQDFQRFFDSEVGNWKGTEYLPGYEFIELLSQSFEPLINSIGFQHKTISIGRPAFHYDYEVLPL